MKGALKAIEEGNVDNLKKALEGIPDINSTILHFFIQKIFYISPQKKSQSQFVKYFLKKVQIQIV